MMFEAVGAMLVCKATGRIRPRYRSNAALISCVRQLFFELGKCKALLVLQVYRKAGHSNCVLHRGRRCASRSLRPLGDFRKALNTVCIACASDPVRSDDRGSQQG